MMRPLAELGRKLSAFDLLDLASGTGGLQLLAGNAERQLRFDRFASVVASIQSGAGRPFMAAPRWRTLMNSAPIGGKSVRQEEDPAPNLFTTSLTFIGGPAIVFPGNSPGCVEVAEFLFAAIFHTPGFPDEYKQTAGAFTYAILRLSDELARRVGLTRMVKPAAAAGAEVVIPAAAEFTRLKAAVIFTEKELADLLAPVTPEVLRRLTTDAGRHEHPTEGEGSEELLYATPFLQVGDRLVVLLPSALLVALRHHLVMMALNSGFEATLAANFRLAVARAVEKDMLLMGLKRQAQFQSEWAHETVWGFDADKVAHVVVVTDDLAGYGDGDIFGRWQPTWQANVEPRLLEFRAWARYQQDDLAGILQLIVVQGIGRAGGVGLTGQVEDPQAHVVMTDEADLALIARQEAGDRLALWKFARALSELYSKVDLIPFSGAIDQYALYAAHRHSFYFTDDAAPSLLSIGPRIGLDLRFKDAQEFDLHGTLSWEQQGIVEVQRFHHGSLIPIYIQKFPAVGSIKFLVEGLAIPVWVFHGEGEQPASELSIDRLCEAVAYWIWQVSASISEAIGMMAGYVNGIDIEVVLAASEAEAVFQIDTPWIEVIPGVEGRISLQVKAEAGPMFLGADNLGERQLLTMLLQALSEMIDNLTQARPAWDIGAIVDRHAPIGPKKIMMALTVAINPELREGNLPPARFVQEADVERLLDAVGPKVAEGLCLEEGRIAPSDRVQVLNWVVHWLFSQLESEIASLSSTKLLELLLLQHESLVRIDAKDRLLMPTRSECFGEDHDLVRIAQRTQRRINASQANRFLIEYVVAQPPTGGRSLSLDMFDQLMALGGEIIAKGTMSDAIKYGLGDIELSILPSGRLGTSRRGRYVDGIEGFRQHRAHVEVESARAAFGHHWASKGSDVGEPSLGRVEELDEAARAEFGFTLTEMVALTAEAVLLAEEMEEPARMNFALMAKTLSAKLGVDSERTKAMIESLALRPRASFFVAGKNFESFPWRFGRDLSYVRRPFLIREEGSTEEIVWGSRHLSGWWENMFGVITGGRLKASSRQMKHLVSEIRAQESEAFNDAVADRFSRQEQLIVRRRVKKIGKLRIALPGGQDLGDVDVLVVDLRRHRILAVETKDFGIARTPWELEQEAKKLFAPQGSAVAQHSRRLQWLKGHIPALCEWLHVGFGGGKWRVEGIIVVSRALLSLYLYDSPIRITTLDHLDLSD